MRHLVFSPDESTFASICDDEIMCVCDSETGHCISGLFQLPYNEHVYNACFNPGRRCILLKLKSYAAVLDIGTGEEQFQIEGLDFIFVRIEMMMSPYINSSLLRYFISLYFHSLLVISL